MDVEAFREACAKRDRGKAAVSEHALQVACMQWLRWVHPEVFCYAIPNGGYRTKRTAGIMHEEGVTPGVPDLHIPMPRGGYASLYIEMKNGKAGRVSERQQAMIERLRGYGNKVVVCRTEEDFRTAIEEYIKD